MRKKTNMPLQTVLTISVGLLLLFWWTQWQWVLVVATIIGVIGLISPTIAHWIDYWWMQLAYVLSLIMPNILLTLIYFCFLVPIAFLARVISKKDTLMLKKPSDSAFRSCHKAFDQQTFKNPW